MNKMTNLKRHVVLLSSALVTGTLGMSAQETESVLKQDTTIVNSKEVKNRNVMLGAGDSSTPPYLEHRPAVFRRYPNQRERPACCLHFLDANPYHLLAL